MKYLLLFCDDPEVEGRLRGMTAVEMEQLEHKVYDWVAQHAQSIITNSRLDHSSRAKSVRFDQHGRPAVTDGPFVESGEVVGGFALIDVSSEDEALKLASAWPVGPVEVRKLV